MCAANACMCVPWLRLHALSPPTFVPSLPAAFGDDIYPSTISRIDRKVTGLWRQLATFCMCWLMSVVITGGSTQGPHHSELQGHTSGLEWCATLYVYIWSGCGVVPITFAMQGLVARCCLMPCTSALKKGQRQDPHCCMPGFQMFMDKYAKSASVECQTVIIDDH